MIPCRAPCPRREPRSLIRQSSARMGEIRNSGPPLRTRPPEYGNSLNDGSPPPVPINGMWRSAWFPGPGRCNQVYPARVGNPSRYPSRLSSRRNEFPTFPASNRCSRRVEHPRMHWVLPHGISTGIRCIRHLRRSAQYSPPPRGYFVARLRSPSGSGGSATKGLLLRSPRGNYSFRGSHLLRGRRKDWLGIQGVFLRKRWGHWAPRYLAARHYKNSSSALPTNWDWAANALDIADPAPLSESVPSIAPLNVRDRLPRPATA